MAPRRVLVVVGARPNYMKVAPLMAELARRPAAFESVLVHTGQHYDPGMSEVFFEQLGMPRPDVELGVGSGTHATQTAAVMRAVEPILARFRPEVVIVVGDVNSTLAVSLVAARAGVPIAHVEAGLRSFDRTMPEEINRVVTDVLSTYLFATEEAAVINLRREGAADDRIFLVGNVMIDTLFALLPAIRARETRADFGLPWHGYGVVTLHRPSNVDQPVALERLLEALATVQSRLPLVFPVHPRTAERLRALGDAVRFDGLSALLLLEPLPYVDFMSLVADARLVLTDSGGIQEETTALGVPCLTLRANTERPVTIRMGTNQLVGDDPTRLLGAVEAVLHTPPSAGRLPDLWDGQAAPRIIDVLAARLPSRPG
jgi:UDP-N-acetylglucosamine 2-epimerase (non-hydrolysing)